MRISQSVCFIALLPSLFCGCMDSDDEAKARTLSRAEFQRRLPDLVERTKKSTNSKSSFRYEKIEIEVNRSYSDDLTFLHEQKPTWENLIIRSSDVGLNTSEFDVLVPIANLKALHVPYISDAAFRRLHELKSLEGFYVSSGGSFLNHLRTLAMQNEKLLLVSLSIPQTYGVKGSGEIFPQRMPNLEFLDLSRTDVSDDDLDQISSLENLRYLYIHGTKISADGIVNLLKCESLEYVNAYDTEITYQEVGETHFKFLLDPVQ